MELKKLEWEKSKGAGLNRLGFVGRVGDI